MIEAFAFCPSWMMVPLARRNGVAALMLVDSRTSASASSSESRDPLRSERTPDARADRGNTMSAFDPRLEI
jgi:hypothetical protein